MERMVKLYTPPTHNGEIVFFFIIGNGGKQANTIIRTKMKWSVDVFQPSGSCIISKVPISN